MVETPRGVVWSAVRDGAPSVSLEPLGESPLREVLDLVTEAGTHVLAKPGVPERKALLENLGASSFLAVPLFDDTMVVGCLLAMDRLGSDEFGESEATMLEALGHELVLTLDSYRLFEEVREERARFQRIFNASKEGICLLDENGVVRAWNPSLVRITGFDANEMIGERWSDVVMVRTKASQRIEGMAIATVEADDELEVVRDDGPSRWVSVVSSPIEAGDEIGWVVQVRDVTAEHLAEEAKSDFLSTVSHELRTPLTTIKGSVSVLSAGRPDPPGDARQDGGVVAARNRPPRTTRHESPLRVAARYRRGVEACSCDVRSRRHGQGTDERDRERWAGHGHRRPRLARRRWRQTDRGTDGRTPLGETRPSSAKARRSR